MSKTLGMNAGELCALLHKQLANAKGGQEVFVASGGRVFRIESLEWLSDVQFKITTGVEVDAASVDPNAVVSLDEIQ